MYTFSFQVGFLDKGATSSLLVKRLIEDLDRQLDEITEHRDTLMGQVYFFSWYCFLLAGNQSH